MTRLIVSSVTMSAVVLSSSLSAQPLSDLAPVYIWLDAPSFGSCSFMHAPVRTRVCIENRGDGAAGPFVVDSGTITRIDGLAGNDGECFFTRDLGFVGLFKVDSENQVLESNEDNNSIFINVPELSSTPTCAATWTRTGSPMLDNSPTSTDSPSPTETPTPTPRPAAKCIGDVDGDNRVTVDEIIGCVFRFTLELPPDECTDAFDANSDEEITVDELVRAVSNVLTGCPPLPTPTSTPRPSAEQLLTICEDVETELASIQHCTSDADCGQVLVGTSCGCTRNLVARNDASVLRFHMLLARLGYFACPNIIFTTTCDCPSVDGFRCRGGSCAWNYVTATPLARTPTRSPTPRPSPTMIGSETVTMMISPCRQCGLGCGPLTDLWSNILLGNVGLAELNTDDTVNSLLPEGVVALGHHVEFIEGAVCAACSCPEHGSPTFYVVVKAEDVAQLYDAGWRVADP